MTSFAERWHVGMAVAGALGGLGAAAVGASPTRRLRPLAVAVCFAAVGLALQGSLVGASAGLASISGAMSLSGRRSNRWIRDHGAGWGGAVGLLMTFVGLWATLPDTEAPLVVAAVLAPLLALMALRGSTPDGLDVVLVLVLGVVVTVVGWAGWTAALLGAACCGTWLIVTMFDTGLGQLNDQRFAVIQLGAHAVAVVIGSRLVAHRPGAAAWIATVIVVLVSVAIRRGTPRRVATRRDGGV